MSLAQQILSEYKMKVSTLEIKPFADGRFEVYVDGTRVFSKHETRRFPEWEEIRPHLESNV